MVAIYCERPARKAVADLVVCTWIDRPGDDRHPTDHRMNQL